MKGAVKFLIKLILVGIVVYFAGRQVVRHWSDVVAYQWHIRPVLIAASLLMHLITFFLFSWTWCVLMSAIGHPVPLRYGFKISYIAHLGRYIPGKIWPIIGQMYLLGRIGIGKKAAVVSWTVAMFYALPSAFLVSALTVWFYPVMAEQSLGLDVVAGSALVLGIALAVAVVSIVAPNQVIRLANWLLKLAGRTPIDFHLTPMVCLRVYIGYFISWVAYGVSFSLLLHGIMNSPTIPLAAGMGSFVMAYLVGYVAIFAPGGIGARELILTSILTPFIGPVAAGVSLVARIWNLVAEAIATAIALAIRMTPTSTDSGADK